MNEDCSYGDGLEDVPRFVPCSLFEKFGIQHVFYKGGSSSVKETKQEQALADVAAEKWQYYEDTYRPLLDSAMKSVNDLNTDAAHGLATGAAASATTKAFGDVRKNTADQLGAGGINPNSGKYQSAMAGLSDAEGAASADNKARASNTVDENFATGLSNISAIGRGQATQTQIGLSDLAHSAADKAANDAEIAWNNRAANLNTVGSLAGAAAYGLNKKKSG